MCVKIKKNSKACSPQRTRTMVMCAMFATIAIVVSRFKFAMSGGLPFKLDFALAVVLVAALINGPSFGVRVEVTLWLLSAAIFSRTLGIGETIDLLISLPAIVLLPQLKSKRLKTNQWCWPILLLAFVELLWGTAVNIATYPVFMRLFVGRIVSSLWLKISFLGGVFSAIKFIICAIAACAFENRIKKLMKPN